MSEYKPRPGDIVYAVPEYDEVTDVPKELDTARNNLARVIVKAYREGITDLVYAVYLYSYLGTGQREPDIEGFGPEKHFPTLEGALLAAVQREYEKGAKCKELSAALRKLVEEGK